MPVTVVDVLAAEHPKADDVLDLIEIPGGWALFKGDVAVAACGSRDAGKHALLDYARAFYAEVRQ